MARLDRSRRFDVAVIGPVTRDRILQVGASADRLGGAAAYSALAYRRHGLQVAVVTNVGAGEAALLEPLARSGLHVAFAARGRTCRFVNDLRTGRRVQQVQARAEPITAAQARAVCSGVRLVHLGPLLPQDLAGDLLDAAAGAGCRVALDVQGYTRRVERGRVRRAVSKRLETALACAHVIKADAEEWEAVLATLGTDGPGLLQAYGLDEAVVTAGARGGTVYAAAGGPVPYEAAAVRGPVDPTGAGDVFFAAYLAARIFGGLGIAAACRRAAEIAARHITGAYLPGACLSIRSQGAGDAR